MSKRYSWEQEEIDHLKNLLDIYNFGKAVEIHMSKYPYRTSWSIREYMNKNNLRGQLPKHTKRKNAWTDEEKQYLIEISKGRTRCEVVDLFQEKYPNRTNSAIITVFKDLKLKSDKQAMDIAFKKRCGGNTKFKKGNIPDNTVPVGTICKRDDYVYIKVRDDGNEKFMLYHRYLWEQHYGEIPEGYYVIFIDGNRYNCTIENLMLVSGNREHAMMRKFTGYNQEVAYAGQKLCKLRMALEDMKKGKK